jgi:hypothetical protein
MWLVFAFLSQLTSMSSAKSFGIEPDMQISRIRLSDKTSRYLPI